MPTVTCFGEVLWDVFPAHKKIGGAPLNVALRLNSFDVNTYVISRVGIDDDGKELLEYLTEKEIDISTIQIDETYETGCVKVTLDSMGSASYKIEAPVAWDKIKVTDKTIKVVKSSDAFIFGSLACRNEVSRNTLFNLLQYARFKVFDVNLRPPFYSMNLLLDLMNTSDFIKCNDQELYEICNALHFRSDSIIEQIKFISKHTQTEQVCVTKGKDGAMLLFKGQLYHNNGYIVKVLDTVGAGDSFLAALISKLLSKIKPDKALNFASAIGALVAGKEGANPKIMQSEIVNFLKKPIEK